IMVTGSHIPDDRNGIKFNMPRTEVLKEHEAGMMAEEVDVAADLFTPEGMFREPRALPTVDGTAAQNYVRRYLEAFPELPLAGLRVGVYQQSAVGRDVMVEILRVLGAEVVPLGRSDRFVPVDTEAIRAEDVALARDWASRNAFDAIVSSDGDSDRPLVADASGEWIRGDVLGVLCARYLGADVVVTPVSSNTVVELCGWFPEVRRTRIGSPYVIEAMMAASSAGALRVVGYEANGGFLIQTPLVLGGRRLAALPTRDCMIVILAVLLLARREGKTLAGLVSTLPRRFTASDRLQGVPTEKSRGILAPLQQQPEESAWAAIERMLGLVAGGRVSAVDHRDGVRVTFDTGDIVHLRPSGNAPEFRCYTEASSRARAEALCAETLALVASLAGVPGPGPLH